MKYITWEEILSNPMWTPLLAFLAILTFVTMIVIFLLSRKKKQLSYDIISSNPVLLRKDEVEGKLEILYNKKPVKDVYLSVIKLINSGNMEIKKDDFEKPVVIDFGKGTEVLTTEISDGIKTELSILEENVMVTPTLLNKGDYITIKTLVSNFQKNEITFTGRIVGVKAIKKYTESKTSAIFMIVGLLMYATGGVLIILALLQI